MEVRAVACIVSTHVDGKVARLVRRDMEMPCSFVGRRLLCRVPSGAAGGVLNPLSTSPSTEQLRKIAMLGTHVPRQFGLATFTSDLSTASRLSPN